MASLVAVARFGLPRQFLTAGRRSEFQPIFLNSYGEKLTADALRKRLRRLGVGLSLDDFGTGYSSLSYLRRLPVDTLKIDRSFIDGAETDPNKIALVESIVNMAQVVDLRVVVEGIENEEQRQFLADLGCDEFQGYLFSKPLSAADATAVLVEQAARSIRNEIAEPAP